MQAVTHGQIDNHGRPVQIVTKELVTSSSYGDHYEPDDDSPREINAVIDPKAANSSLGLFGAEVESDVVAYVRDDIENLRGDGGGEGASELTIDDVDYRAIRVADYGTGLVALACERQTSGGAE